MTGHVPVLLDEVIEALSPRDDAHYVDGTFGGGGYARAILDRAELPRTGDRPRSRCDRARAPDGAALRRPPDAGARPYSELERLLAEAGEEATDGVVLDLGVSSFQLDQAERGFRSGSTDPSI